MVVQLLQKFTLRKNSLELYNFCKSLLLIYVMVVQLCNKQLTLKSAMVIQLCQILLKKFVMVVQIAKGLAKNLECCTICKNV